MVGGSGCARFLGASRLRLVGSATQAQPCRPDVPLAERHIGARRVRSGHPVQPATARRPVRLPQRGCYPSPMPGAQGDHPATRDPPMSDDRRTARPPLVGGPTSFPLLAIAPAWAAAPRAKARGRLGTRKRMEIPPVLETLDHSVSCLVGGGMRASPDEPMLECFVHGVVRGSGSPCSFGYEFAGPRVVPAHPIVRPEPAARPLRDRHR
jgi:hypothetical protein